MANLINKLAFSGKFEDMRVVAKGSSPRELAGEVGSIARDIYKVIVVYIDAMLSPRPVTTIFFAAVIF